MQTDTNTSLSRDRQNPNVEPIVTVIVTTFNYGKYLGQALQSIQRQKYTAWECIVVDDGSTDDTKELFSVSDLANDKRIRYVYQKNGGLSSARNKGLELARGNYIQFLDADDILWSQKLGTHVEILEKQTDIDVVYGQYGIMFDDEVESLKIDLESMEVSPSRPKTRESVTIYRDPFSDFLHSWEKGFSIPIHCYLFRRECFRWGNFDTELPTHEDIDLALRFSVSGARYQMTDGEYVIYRIHGSSMARDLTRMHKGYLLALLKLMRNPASRGRRGEVAHRYFQEYFNTAMHKVCGRKLSFRKAVGNPGAGTLNGLAFVLLPLYLLYKIQYKLFGHDRRRV